MDAGSKSRLQQAAGAAPRPKNTSRTEFLLKTDSGYPRDAGGRVNLATPGSYIEYYVTLGFECDATLHVHTIH